MDVLRGVNPYQSFVPPQPQTAPAIRDDAESGRIRALEAISQIAEDAEEVELLVRVCVAVSWADGELHPAERTQIEDICKLLDAEPPDFKAPG